MLHIYMICISNYYFNRKCDVLDRVFSEESSRVFSQFYESIYAIRKLEKVLRLLNVYL